MVDLADDLVLIHAHLVQLLRLPNQQILPSLVDRLRQMLALPGSDPFRLRQAACASDATDADHAICSDQQLLLLALVRCFSATGVRLSVGAVAGQRLPREYLTLRLPSRGLLRLNSVEIHQMLLERIDWLLGLRLEARVRPLLLGQAWVVLRLQEDKVLLVFGQITCLGA